MMAPLSLADQRCEYHPGREAVARCPECGRYFCRECVTEHADRVLCVNCLQKMSRQEEKPRRRFGGVSRLLLAMTGIVLGWFFFYSMGRGLLLMPDSFHEGTLWRMGEGSP